MAFLTLSEFNMEDISIEWAFMIRREVDSNLLSFTCIVGNIIQELKM